MPRYIFAVECAERSTGRPYTIEVEADSDRNAVFTATAAGAVTSGARLARILPDSAPAPSPASHASVPGTPDPYITSLTRSQFISAVSSAIVWGWLKILAFSAIVGAIVGIAIAVINAPGASH